MTKEGEALHHSGRPQGPRGGGARGQPGEGTEQAVPGLPVLGHQTLSSDGAHQGHAQQGGALPVRLRREVQDLLRLQRPPEEARTWQLGTGLKIIPYTRLTPRYSKTLGREKTVLFLQSVKYKIFSTSHNYYLNYCITNHKYRMSLQWLTASI